MGQSGAGPVSCPSDGGQTVTRRRPLGHAAVVDDRYEPADIDVARDEAVTITYQDGQTASFDLMTLRLGCPCAQCRSLRDRGERVWPGPGSPTPLRITNAELHGAWGLTIEWNDGHATGIFPFELLRRWRDGESPPGRDAGPGTGVKP